MRYLTINELNFPDLISTIVPDQAVDIIPDITVIIKIKNHIAKIYPSRSYFEANIIKTLLSLFIKSRTAPPLIQ
jgi:hypothetical protein